MRKLQTYIRHTAISKILEKLVYDQLLNYLNNNKIITKRQSGFRKYHSTETALLQSTNEYLMNMDRGLINGVLFLDLKRHSIQSTTKSFLLNLNYMEFKV